MENMELLEDVVLQNRKEIDGMSKMLAATINAHNKLADANTILIKKHNGLCRATMGICGIMFLLTWMNWSTSKELEKLKKEQENKEKEG